MRLNKIIAKACVVLLFFCVNIPSAKAIGPQLVVDCGNWDYLQDSAGKYRELTAVALFGYAGPKFKYQVNFYNTSKSRTSLGVFKGTYVIENPENEVHETELPINMKFRNNKYSATMYKSKYIRGEFKFTDIQGFEAYQTCIWKWSK
jgi:hypothetical protein